MKFILVAHFVFMLILSVCTLANKQDQFFPKKNDEFKYGYYVPSDIHDAISELQRAIQPSLKKEFSAIEDGSYLADYHHGLGSWLRRHWLYEGSRLNQYFKSYGLVHLDNMSSIIIAAYWRILKGKDLQFDKLIANAQYSEQAIMMPPLNNCPDNPTSTMKYVLMGALPVNGNMEFMHVGQCIETDKYWVFQVNKGWMPVTKEQTDAIEYMIRMDKEEQENNE